MRSECYQSAIGEIEDIYLNWVKRSLLGAKRFVFWYVFVWS